MRAIAARSTRGSDEAQEARDHERRVAARHDDLVPPPVDGVEDRVRDELGRVLPPAEAVRRSPLPQISVSIGPGWTSATWMPEPRRSFQRPSVKPFIAHFAAA